MSAAAHNSLCQLADISSWLHPQRYPMSYQSLSKPQQNRLLCLQHRLRLPQLADLIASPTVDVIAHWEQLPRLSLLVGSLGLIGLVHTMRLQSLYRPADLAFVAALSQQCLPIPARQKEERLNEALLCERGWRAVCQSYQLPDEVERAGRLALPPSTLQALQPLPLSQRLNLTLNKILHYLQATP